VRRDIMKTTLGFAAVLGFVLGSAATASAATVQQKYPLCPDAEATSSADEVLPGPGLDQPEGMPWHSYFRGYYIVGYTDSLHGFSAGDQVAPGDISIYAKWGNAALMAQYGIDDSYMPTEFVEQIGPVRPWHSKLDYQRVAQAHGNRAHDEYHPYFNEKTRADGTIGLHEYHDAGTLEGVFGTASTWETVDLYCPLFDSTSHPTSADPVLRSAVMVHEGQHSWEHKHQSGHYGHSWCPSGTGVEFKCDTPHFHSKTDYAGGDLYDGTENPYQVEYEYLCDLAEFPSAWLPRGYVLLAMNHAAGYRNRFEGGVQAPACGDIYPLGRQDSEYPYCLSAGGNYCSCRDGWTLCPLASACVDTSANESHCGACNNVCPTGSYCNSGVCEAPTDCQFGVCGVDCALSMCWSGEQAGCCQQTPE
jgi:hypothetical protein